MPYKDAEKRKAVNRAAAQRKRDKDKGMTANVKIGKCQDAPESKKSVIPDDNHPQNVTPAVTPSHIQNVIPNYGQPDCQCKHCQQNRNMGGKLTINHGQWKSADQLASNEVNRVSLPCDVDYIAQHIADNGGEASFKTVKGEVQDLHIIETPLQPTTQPQEAGC